MADDKTLSEKIISAADALQEWQEMEPIATKVTSLVNEYREVIDGVGTVFAVVGFVWNIYSNMEKAKEDAAQQQAMVEQIIHAVDGMIKQAATDIKRHIDAKEIDAAINAVNTVQQGFRHDVVPHATTFPLKDFDTVQLDLLIFHAREAIETLHTLIPARAEVGDGAAVVTLYRNLQAIVQCKLTMDNWRHGQTSAVVGEAEYEMTRLTQVWASVVRGLERMSDRSFSPGIIRFHVGGGGRPELTRYSYQYYGKPQPVSGSNLAPVSQAFIEARQMARGQSIPQEVIGWAVETYKIFQQVQELKGKMPA